MESIESIIFYINNTKEWPLGIKLKHLKQLSGGLVNYVYRLTFEDDSTVILKYFPGFLAVDKSIEMNQNRYFIEKESLKLLSDNPKLKSNRLKIPKLIYFDDKVYLLVMQDAGVQSKTLFEYLMLQNCNNLYQAENMIDFIAKELYNFSAFLKNSGISPITHKEPFKNETLWNKLRSYLIPLYSSEATRLNLEYELEVHIDKANRLLRIPDDDEGFFVYGDLWPNSILIDEEKSLIWIIDWEMARFETRENRDLEQLIANLWIMKQKETFFNTKLIERLIKRLQLEYFGSENADYRQNSDDLARSNFILWILSLIKDTAYWGLEDFTLNGEELVRKALLEI